MEMVAVAPNPPPWIPEDDLLLKNAIEAGASMEALAKGAVQFSRRFTIQELVDRWHSLLYDPDISAQASARMGELQGSASNLSSEFNKTDKAIQSKTVLEKRKLGSVQKQYYAKRKRIRSEFFSSVDLGFFVEPNLHNFSGNGFHEHVTLDNGPPVGNCTANHFSLQETDFDILHHEFHPEGPDSLGTVGADIFQQRLAFKDNPHNLEGNLVELGQCSGVEEMGSSRQMPSTKLFESDGVEPKPLLATLNSTSNNLQNVCSDFGGAQHINSPNSDGGASFHAMGSSPLFPSVPPRFSPPFPSVPPGFSPLWKTMEDMSAPSMPVNVSPRDKSQGAEDVSALPFNNDNERKSPSRHGVVHSGSTLTDRPNVDGFINSTALSDGEFADLSESLLDFPNEDDILFMDVDGDDTVDKSCYGSSLLLSSPTDATEGDAPKVEPKKMIGSNTGIATAGSAHLPDSEVIISQLHYLHGDQIVSRSGVNMPATSVLSSKPFDLSLGNTFCTLNTEDPEIPCNDDIFLLIHPAPSLAFSATRPIARKAIDPSSSADEKETGQRTKLGKKVEDPAQFLLPSQLVGPHILPATAPKHALVSRTVKSELPDSSCKATAPRLANKAVGISQSKSAHTTPKAADVKLESNITKVEFGVVENPVTFGEIPLHPEAGPVATALPESVVHPSTSDHEDPESDNDVPYFSDIEAMILEMDLGSYDQDSYFTSRVSRYQQQDSKRKIIRLEQCAKSSLQRAMTSQEALAILYGRRLKHFIRKPEVILGRSTDEVEVDIDLGKEGRANKISRRQATIKMERDGSFFLKNLGKTAISVNGKEVAIGQSLVLSSNCLIEIRGMSFIFEMNHKLCQ